MSTNCFLYNRCNHKDCDKEFCLRRYKLEFLYSAANISETQREHVKLSLKQDSSDDAKDVQAFQRLSEISSNIEDFVSSGKSLFLHSRISGNGKSSWSLRLIESFFNRIWPKTELKCRALFISVPRFLLSLKDNISDKNNYISYIKDNILEADLVVWDDIAAKTGTEYEINNLLSLVDARISLGKSNIYTSNLNQREMMQALGSRLTSRICNMSEDIELFGVDKRNWVRDND